MKRVAVIVAIGVLVTETIYADVKIPLSTNDVLLVKESLEAFDQGKADLDELSWSRTERQKLIAYYLRDTNAVSLKGKLLISRSFALEKSFPQAAELAEKYVQVYSNDWRGWRILGSSSCALSNWNKGVMAFTNAVILGDEACYQLLAIAALQADRLDLVRDIVPHLLILKEAKRTAENDKLEIVMGLALYAYRADQQDVFVKALEGVPTEKILSRKDVSMAVRWGCEKFSTRETQSICKELEGSRKVKPEVNKSK